MVPDEELNDHYNSKLTVIRKKRGRDGNETVSALDTESKHPALNSGHDPTIVFLGIFLGKKPRPHCLSPPGPLSAG